ncbi:hypothetical protein PCE1_003364 [Barthelona sp. PCE]
MDCALSIFTMLSLLCSCFALSSILSSGDVNYYDRASGKLFDGSRWSVVSNTAFDNHYSDINDMITSSNDTSLGSIMKKWGQTDVYRYTKKICTRRVDGKCKSYRYEDRTHTYRINVIHTCTPDYCLSARLPMSVSSTSQNYDYYSGNYKSDPWEIYLNSAGTLPTDEYSMEPFDVNQSEMKIFTCSKIDNFVMCIRDYDFPIFLVIGAIVLFCLIIAGIAWGAVLFKRFRETGSCRKGFSGSSTNDSSNWLGQ